MENCFHLKQQQQQQLIAVDEEPISSTTDATATTSFRSQLPELLLPTAAADDELNPPNYCSSQEYEIMKDNLLLYSHARLMSQDNNHSKDFLVSIMFSHYDQNNNANLEMDELNQITFDEHLDELSNGCALADMLNFDDTNHDGRLSINEFYQAFSKLYSVSVVSLDKALETNHLSARVGDNVEIKCDVTGSPSPPLIWQRNGLELSALNEEDVRVFSDGSLYLTHIQLYHGGNYSCHAQRNKDVVQTHILSVYTIPEVKVLPRMQSKRPGEMATMLCHINGDPYPRVEWLKNDEPISNNQNLNNNKFQLIGNGSSLRINNIKYSDTGAYMCQATNIGGSVRDISSLIVQEESLIAAVAANDERKYFVFHEFGIAIYEPASCRLYHQIQNNDIIAGTQIPVCGGGGGSPPNQQKCSWGRAVNVGTRYIYASQPELNRLLVISTIQMVVIDVIRTADKYPVELFYVPRLDQIWFLCWNFSTETTGGRNILRGKKILMIRNAGQKNHKHNNSGGGGGKQQKPAEPIRIGRGQQEQQYDLIKMIYIPSGELEQPHYSYKYGYVTHLNQLRLYKLNLENQRYKKSIDLTRYNCVPDDIEFSALYGYVIIACSEPKTNRPNGQLILDYLTDAVLKIRPDLIGKSKVSPDSRHLATIDHRNDEVVIIIQKIKEKELEFLFDVKTTLNISDLTYYESQSMHGYDLFATASDKEDILFLNIYTGKVEMITGVGTTQSDRYVQWNNPARPIKSSGLFGQYLITPANNNSLYIINGRSRTINCQIDGPIILPVAVVWVYNLMPKNYAAATVAAISNPHNKINQKQFSESKIRTTTKTTGR